MARPDHPDHWELLAASSRSTAQLALRDNLDHLELLARREFLAKMEPTLPEGPGHGETMASQAHREHQDPREDPANLAPLESRALATIAHSHARPRATERGKGGEKKDNNSDGTETPTGCFLRTTMHYEGDNKIAPVIGSDKLTTTSITTSMR